MGPCVVSHATLEKKKLSQIKMIHVESIQVVVVKQMNSEK